MTTETTPLEFGYTNWRGEYDIRTAVPVEVWFGIGSRHGETPMWFLKAIDAEKGERDFALKDFGIRHEGKAQQYADALAKLLEASELAIAALPEEQRGGTVGTFLSAIRNHAAGALQ